MSELPVKKVPEASPDFAAIHTDETIYVDKTAYFHRLITQNRQFASYFVARPRRFGKSLMLSTLQYIFEGRRDLFKGLYIAEQTDYDWPVFPVVKVDFSAALVTDRTIFEEMFARVVKKAFRPFGYAYSASLSPEANFADGMDELIAGRGRVVVLIDEYDAPIGHAMADAGMAAYVRNRLSNFFVLLKSYNKDIRFMMLTGVSKFAQLSVFSSLNTPKDLSFDADYATMLGYTDEELDTCFRAHMLQHAGKMGKPYEAYRREFKSWYNGYCFAPGAESVYNPISVGLALDAKPAEFGATWISSGPPAMLVNYLHEAPGALNESIFSTEVTSTPVELGSSSEIGAIAPLPLFYQTGYLTIAGEKSTLSKLYLRIPDEEIRRSLYALYIDRLADHTRRRWREDALNLIEHGEFGAFLDELKDLFAEMPYGSLEVPKLIHEGQYRRILMFMFGSRGIPCVAEKEQSNRNRSDLVVLLEHFVCIFELKNNASLTAEDALRQIHAKDYAKPYRHAGRRLIFIGIVFNPDDHTILDARFEEQPLSDD